MILTADAETARHNRRETPRGWSTPFIGANRYTIRPGDPIPAADALHPVAFLVERGPGGITKPHFHQADQYQVVVSGYGKLGPHDTGTVAVHYTDAYSAYGPIVAADEGIAWFTLRNCWDPGAKYMADLDSRAELRASRGIRIGRPRPIRCRRSPRTDCSKPPRSTANACSKASMGWRPGATACRPARR